LFAQEDKNQFQTPPLEEAELPDWLMATPQDQEADHKESPISQAQPDEMAPAHLPSWLEAMRPVEAVISMTPLSEEGADVVESAGPLAGLRALLPAEPEAALSRKTSTLSVKLQVPEKQQTHATLLSELIKSEGEVRPLPGRSVVTGQYTLRLIIVVVLLLSLLWPLIPGAPQVQVPALPGEGLAFKQIIENLEPGAPVLVAFDYQPGLSGEMDAATDSVIVHLVNRSVFLTLVSTIPTGPLQAESLLNRIRQRGGPDILTQDQYTNLGYIPGGQTGLRSLAEFPRQIVPYPLTSSQTGGNTWDQPALQNIQAISGFRLVVVATDNPDVARAWIEQVQTSSPNLPLVMIVSAQAEPLVRPYYENNPRQIQGMVSGLAGGAAYEAATGQISSAAPHWTGFSISALIAGLLISLGGLANIVIGLYGQTKKTTDGEATR
jgi:hypothetical protein